MTPRKNEKGEKLEARTPERKVQRRESETH